MKKFAVFTCILLFIAIVSFAYIYNKGSFLTNSVENISTDLQEELNQGGPLLDPHPLSIEALRNGEFPGSDITIEQTLTPGSNYQRYLASYKSDGLKIFALLTVPNQEAPEGGFPVVIFNHGYIPPDQYRTTERYIAYTDAFSRNGYVLFRSDYRGHGSSEGRAEGGYGSNAYTIDILNALSSVKKLDYINPEKIGMWGHSMGGHITLRTMVANSDVKAGVIWAGVVASYPNLLENWHRRRETELTPFPTRSNRGGWRNGFVQMYGTPEENPDFWNSISSNAYLEDISGPLQLHHGTQDSSVPYEFSVNLEKELKDKNKTTELYIYEGDDHNISNNLSTALTRSVEFFDKYLK